MTTPRTVLAFDTGSPTLSVTLTTSEGEFDHREPQSRSSAQLPTIVEQLLDQADRTWADLDAVIAARGPGSFTGLRVGLAFALGLHQALGIRATAIPTLELLARSSRIDGKVTAAINAWRDSWFAQTFSAAPRVPLGEPRRVSVEELAAGSDLVVTSTPAPELPRAEVPSRSIASTAAALAAQTGVEWNAATLTEPLYLAAAPAVRPDSPRVQPESTGP